MYIPNATPPIVQANAVPAAAAPQESGGAVSDVFAALLASLQGLVSPPASTGATLPGTVCPECETEDAGEADAAEATESGGPSTADAAVAGEESIVSQSLAAQIPVPVIVANPNVNGDATAEAEVAPPAPKPVADPRPATATVPNPTPGASQTPVSPEVPVPVAGPVAEGDPPIELPIPAVVSAVSSADESAEVVAPKLAGDTLKPIRTAAAEPAPVLVEVLDEGAPKVASDPAAPVRTVRQLLREAVEAVTARTKSAAVAPAPQPGESAAPARTPVEVIPELAPVSGESASKAPAAPTAPVVAPPVIDSPAPETVQATPREAARVTLPQSVDVRDVGDVTVRSVRYLSGRTEEVVTVRLVPRSLGEMHVAVRSTVDGLDVVLTASTHAARERLEGQLVGLRDLLVRDGMDVNRVTVQAPPSFDLAGHLPSSHQQHQSTGHAARFHAPLSRQPESNPPDAQPSASARPQHDGGLNMLA